MGTLDLDYWNLEMFTWFVRTGENWSGVPGETPLRARTRISNKLYPHMTPSPGIERHIGKKRSVLSSLCHPYSPGIDRTFRKDLMKILRSEIFY